MADIRINALATTATTPASDDYLALDGAAQGTRKILATNIANNVTDVILGASGPSVKSTLSARAPRQGLVFDGTAGATTSVPAFGTSDFSVSFISRLTDVSVAQSIVSGTAGALILNISGALYLYKQGTGSLGSVAGVFESGKIAQITVTRSGTGVIVYKNGIQAGTMTIASTDFTGATGFIGSTDGTNEKTTGLIGGLLIYNRALSAAEVVALYESGAPSGADYNSASNTAVNTEAVLNTGIPYTTFGSATSTGFAATSNGSGSQYAEVRPTQTIRAVGVRYLVTFTLTLNSGTAPKVSFGAASLVGGAKSNVYQSVAGSNSVVLTTTDSGAHGLFFYNNATTTDYVVSNLSVTRQGLLLAPDAAQAGGGYVWNDQSGNLAQIVLPSSGVQWNLPSVAGQRIRGTTSTNGNEQLLGASVLLPAECQITHVRARARSGTPTITIGTASGGAQIVASVALSTTWLNCTIALTGGIVSSADDIWVGSNSTDVVETDIAFQPLDF